MALSEEDRLKLAQQQAALLMQQEERAKQAAVLMEQERQQEIAKMGTAVPRPPQDMGQLGVRTPLGPRGKTLEWKSRAKESFLKRFLYLCGVAHACNPAAKVAAEGERSS